MFNRCPELPIEPPEEDERIPRCPVCGAECEIVYYDNITHTYAGCDVCKTGRDALSVLECFPEEDWE